MTHTATDGLGARYRARTLSDGPTLAEVTVSDVADLCNTWMNTPGIAWWRKRAAREIMDTLTAEPDPTSDLAIAGMGTEHGEAVLNTASAQDADPCDSAARRIADILQADGATNLEHGDAHQIALVALRMARAVAATRTHT